MPIFTAATRQRQPKCPSTDDCVTICHLPNEEVTDRKEIMTC